MKPLSKIMCAGLIGLQSIIASSSYSSADEQKKHEFSGIIVSRLCDKNKQDYFLQVKTDEGTKSIEIEAKEKDSKKRVYDSLHLKDKISFFVKSDYFESVYEVSADDIRVIYCVEKK